MKNEIFENDEITLMEIPIYKFDEETFNKIYKLDEQLEKDSKVKFNEMYKSYHDRVWIYNHVCGILQVYLKDHTDIYFGTYKPSPNENEIRISCTPPNTHFRIDNMTNRDISVKIFEYLKTLKNWILKSNNYYIDLEEIREVIKFIDYNKIIK